MLFAEFLKNQKNKNGNGVNMSGSRHAPKLGKVVGNGLRMVARGCHGSPEVLTGIKRCLETVPGPGGAARGEIRRNRGVPPASSIVGSAAWRSHSILESCFLQVEAAGQCSPNEVNVESSASSSLVNASQALPQAATTVCACVTKAQGRFSLMLCLTTGGGSQEKLSQCMLIGF